MAITWETTWASEARHQGVIDAILPDGHVHFGSDQQGQTQVQNACGFGASAHEARLTFQERPLAVPRFCGGAGDMAEHEPAFDDDNVILVEDPPTSGQTTLDYVLQNLHGTGVLPMHLSGCGLGREAFLVDHSSGTKRGRQSLRPSKMME